MASGSTPVASGSSVPVWPMRDSRKARRAAATTSCEVSPCGLSIIRMPSIGWFVRWKLAGSLVLADRLVDGFRELPLEQRGQLRQRPRGTAPGGVLVPAAAKLLGHRVHVDRSL